MHNPTGAPTSVLEAFQYSQYNSIRLTAFERSLHACR